MSLVTAAAIMAFPKHFQFILTLMFKQRTMIPPAKEAIAPMKAALKAVRSHGNLFWLEAHQLTLSAMVVDLQQARMDLCVCLELSELTTVFCPKDMRKQADEFNSEQKLCFASI